MVQGEAERLTFPDRDLSILAVPDALRGDHPVLEPDSAFKHNILVIHCEITGMLAATAAAPERTVVEVSPDEIGPARWSYVALGHYHVYRQLAPNMATAAFALARLTEASESARVPAAVPNDVREDRTRIGRVA